MIRTLALLAALASAQAFALEARTLTEGGRPYTVVTADPARDDLRLFWKNPKGEAFVDFERLEQWAKGAKLKLEFAMNAGMYMQDSAPLGLYVENGKKLRPLNRRSGAGNFYMKPNGVFFIEGGTARVVDTSRFETDHPSPRLATQSGPMLVIDGKIHAGFPADSLNRLIRNGVGVDAAGKVVFAISDGPVNFHEFAALFRDRLGCKNALYLDGSVSRARVPALGRIHEDGFFGPILGVVKR